ncbi:GNAT family N-acetyltransferase [Lysobacter koreensis]|uniref:GNAT family N-acetyltransferase n=1 Tax=Lysobacter koreensis TaxID=266122 RepID=A0ABW2YPZ2_9GAMM
MTMAGDDAAPTSTQDTASVLDDLPVLDGERIRLRGFREDDLHDLYAVHSDPQVMRYWSFPAWTELAQAQDRLANAMSGRDPRRLLCWAIAERGDDRLVGGVTLFSIDRAQGRAEVGYSLRSDRWGRGLAREALQLALAHAFDGLGLRRVEADVDPRNAASCALVERFGFVREGLLRERWLVAGELQDSAIYGLLARDWRARQGG